MTTILTYGTVTLDGSEILNVKLSTGLQIEENDTFNPKVVTQPGNIKPITFDISASIRKNTSAKFDTWLNLILTRPLENLIVYNRNFGLTYFNSLDITSTELEKNGDVLFFDMELSFTQNVNF